MRILKLAIAGGIAGIMLAGGAQAQQSAATDELRQPTSVERVVSYDSYVSFAAQDAQKVADGSPSDKAPPAANKPATKQEPPAPAAEEKKEAANGEEKKDEEKAEEEGPWKLIKSPCLDAHRIDIRGWLDQGFTWNPQNPTDRFNGPVGYNDRANEYQLNQLYLIAERVTKTDGCGIDFGGRVDLLYGTDRRFVTAYELDAEWNQDSRFYGLAMPQAYGDIAINNLTIRGGHFLAPCGYESVMAPENFFYSHSYGFLYGQPTTLSGGEAMYKLNDQWTANAGIDTGWNDWLAPNGKINYFGGVNWTSKDQKTTMALELFLGNTNPIQGVDDSERTHYCFVLTRKLGEKWRYAFENNMGYDTDPFATGTHGDWLTFANYLFYDLNACWSFGARYEWVDDDDGTVVVRTGPPTLGPYASHFNTVAFGTNYKPNKNIIVRSEIRWDWAGNDLPAGQRPFDDGDKNHQFLWGTDLIVRF